MGYEEIFSYEHLLEAHKKTRKGKLHKDEVIAFELNKGEEIYRLYEELKRKTYKISPYRTFYIYEPKMRRVDATSYRDRIVQRCFIDNYLSPLLENRLIYDNAACRVDKGTDFARERLKMFMREEYKRCGASFYVFRFDIHHYFESINHSILKNKMKRIADEGVYPFIEMIIDSFGDEDKGLPLGNQSSQWFALFYLDAFDRVIKERYGIKYYSRYMDDGVLLCRDKAILLDLKERLEGELRGLKLEFNERKIAISPSKQGIDYLGFHYSLNGNGRLVSKMSNPKKRRLIRYLHSYGLDEETLLSYVNYLKMRSDNHHLINELNGRIRAIGEDDGRAIMSKTSCL